MSSSFELHPRLAEDCIYVTNLRLSQVLLMNDARFIWLILVPERKDRKAYHDFEPLDRYRLSDEMVVCSEVLRDLYQPAQINVAALGNMVPQFHMHVVARFREDVAWPGPVWGSGTAEPYSEEIIAQRLVELRQVIKHT